MSESLIAHFWAKTSDLLRKPMSEFPALENLTADGYCLSLCDEIFDHFPVFDNTFAFWSHTVKRKKRNPPTKCLTVHANIYNVSLQEYTVEGPTPGKPKIGGQKIFEPPYFVIRIQKRSSQ